MTETSPLSFSADQPLREETNLRAADTTPEAPTKVMPPPTRFNAAAREDWALTPGTVRAEVLRLEGELIAGLKKHQAAAVRDAELAEFYVRAAGSGTTLREALSRYVSLENLLRTDPDMGLTVIFRNIGLDLQEWATRLLGHHEKFTVDTVLNFAAAHPRFDELADDIVFFLETGRADDLSEAYDLAQRFASANVDDILNSAAS